MVILIRSSFCSNNHESTANMAFLMISAAVPCIGALIAARSAAFLRMPFLALMSGKYKRRPYKVST